MKKNLLLKLASYILLVVLFPAGLSAQGIEIPSGAGISVTGAATIEVVDGNFLNYGTYTKGAETFIMSGTNTAGLISGTALSDFNNLTISNSQGISIDVNTPVTVSGTMVNSAGVNGLILKSNASGNASLIQNSALVQGRVERAFVGTTWTEWNDGWHLLSSPVDNQSVSGEWTPSGVNGDYDFYAWTESAVSDNWLNQKVAGNNITAFIQGQGYLVAYELTDLKEFAGNLNYQAVSFSGLTHTSGNSYAGWHLVGNPFTSAIDWNHASWTKTNIGANAKLWVEASKSYEDVIADYNDIIPAMNGFMVYVEESTTGSLTIPVEARVHSTTNWLKTMPSDFIVLTARETEGNSAQETIIRMNPESTNGFDPTYDSKFMAGFAPMLYSVADGDYLSLNTIPDLNSNRTIDLGFLKNNATEFTIELSMENHAPGLKVYLTDKLTGSVTDMLNNPVYHFISADGDNTNRFALQFASVGITETTESTGYKVFSYGKSVSVSTSGQAEGDIFIRNMTGQLVKQTGFNGKSIRLIDLAKLPGGVYIVSVKDGKTIYSIKVVL